MNIIDKQTWTGTRLNVPSAWKGLECFLPGIINNLNIKTNLALEFGVDHGYSTHILSQLFSKVVGVDSFIGDQHINHMQDDDFYNIVLQRLADTKVQLYRQTYQEFIADKQNDVLYDLIHIDIVHLYKETFECADWAVQHSNVVILHDTESFPEIKRVCMDIAAKHKYNFYNIPDHFGLGVLYK